MSKNQLKHRSTWTEAFNRLDKQEQDAVRKFWREQKRIENEWKKQRGFWI